MNKPNSSLLLQPETSRPPSRCPFSIRIPAHPQGRVVSLGVCLTALALLAVGCAQPGREQIVVRPAALPSKTSEPSATAGVSLDVLTFNIWGLPRWLTGAPPQRYTEIADHLSEVDADVILLQEMWTKAARQALPQSGPWAVATTRNSGCVFRRNGLATLSTYPVLAGEFRAFKAASFPDVLVNKGALKVTLELPGKNRVNVWNVHLQSYGAERTRSRQIEELISWVNEADDGQLVDVVAGDFNCRPDSDQLRRLCQAFGGNLLPAPHTPPFSTYQGHPGDPSASQTLDYVFVRPRRGKYELQAKVEPALTSDSFSRRCSDHVAVHAQVELEWTPTPTFYFSHAPFHALAALPLALLFEPPRQ